MVPNFNNYSFSLSREDFLGLDLSLIEEKDAIQIEKLRILELDLFLDNLFNFIEKISDNTSIIITGDHGSPFLKKYSKKTKLKKIDDEIPTLNFRRTNVPFYVEAQKFKDKTYNSDKEQLVSGNIDLSKTILDICGIESSEFKNGVSIFDKNKKKSRYIRIYIQKNLLEIAVIKKDYSYFERYEFDHQNFKIRNNIPKKNVLFYQKK